MLYSEKDLENSMAKIETIDFHQEIEVNGVKFWCYHAGHVLGAAMFMIEIAGVRVSILFNIDIFPFNSRFVKNRFYIQAIFQELKIGI
jgi:Cft2 family RNA processing exonuclease